MLTRRTNDDHSGKRAAGTCLGPAPSGRVGRFNHANEVNRLKFNTDKLVASLHDVQPSREVSRDNWAAIKIRTETTDTANDPPIPMKTNTPQPL